MASLTQEFLSYCINLISACCQDHTALWIGRSVQHLVYVDSKLSPFEHAEVFLEQIELFNSLYGFLATPAPAFEMALCCCSSPAWDSPYSHDLQIFIGSLSSISSFSWSSWGLLQGITKLFCLSALEDDGPSWPARVLLLPWPSSIPSSMAYL